MTGILDTVIGPRDGTLWLHTGREGVAATVGHDLAIEVTRWSGELTADQVRLTADLASLEVRSGRGGARPLTDGDRAQITRTMRELLHGSAGFASTRLVPAGDGGTIEGALTIHGVTRPVTVQVTASAGRYRGTATVTQSAFGIRPYRAFLGALRLRDAVTVELELTPSSGPARSA